MAPKLSLYIVLGIVAAILHLAVGKPSYRSLFNTGSSMGLGGSSAPRLGHRARCYRLISLCLDALAMDSNHRRRIQFNVRELTGRNLDLALLSSTVREIFPWLFARSNRCGLGCNRVWSGSFSYRRALVPG